MQRIRISKGGPWTVPAGRHQVVALGPVCVGLEAYVDGAWRWGAAPFAGGILDGDGELKMRVVAQQDGTAELAVDSGVV